MRITPALQYTSEKKPFQDADCALSPKNRNSLRAITVAPFPAFHVRTQYEDPPFFDLAKTDALPRKPENGLRTPQRA